MASKVQSFLSSVAANTSSESQVKNCHSNWTSELMPSIKKLRQAIQCLLKTSKLAYSIISLKVFEKIFIYLVALKCIDLCYPRNGSIKHEHNQNCWSLVKFNIQ